MSKKGLDKAIEVMGGDGEGGGAALANAIGVSAQLVSFWRKNRVPAEHCPAIERATGGKVKCEDLRPDVPWGVLREQAA